MKLSSSLRERPSQSTKIAVEEALLSPLFTLYTRDQSNLFKGSFKSSSPLNLYLLSQYLDLTGF